MSRLNIDITAPASDDALAQAEVMVGCKAELTALKVRLGELLPDAKIAVTTRFVREVERKPKKVPANPAAPAADAAAEAAAGAAQGNGEAIATASAPEAAPGAQRHRTGRGGHADAG